MFHTFSFIFFQYFDKLRKTFETPTCDTGVTVLGGVSGFLSKLMPQL